MATLEKLRNRAGLLVAIVIGLALIAFILGDIMGPGGSVMGQSDMDIAEISGKSISYQEYQGMVDYLTELNRGQTQQGSLDEQTLERIREEVWADIVRETIMDRRYSRLGLAISSEELFDMIQGRNIHPIIHQQFTNPQTGQLEREYIIQFLKTLDMDPSGFQRHVWLYLEQLIQKDRIFEKYNVLVQKGLYSTTLQAERSVADRTKRVDFDYVLSRYTSVNDSLVNVTEREIRSYYSENKKEFEQAASRDIEYVLFPITPSAEDHGMAQDWVDGILADFSTASDPIHFVNLNSDNPFDSRFLTKDDIANEELAEWAFSAKVDEVFPPYFDGESFRMARLIAAASLPDSVRARHILIQPQGQSIAMRNQAKDKADSLHSVVKAGGNFARLAQEFSDDPGSASEGGDLGWFPEGIMVQPFNDAAFGANRGEVVLVETQFGYHIIEVLERGRPSPKVQLAILERRVVPSSRTYQVSYSKASEFAGLYNKHEQFSQAAQEQRLTKRTASNLKEGDRRIAGLENPREMIRWAFNAKEGSVSPVFELGENFVVATLVKVREDGSAPLADVRDEVVQRLMRDKKAELISEKFDAAIKQNNDLEGIAKALELSPQQASRISFTSFSIPGAGFEPAVIATAVSIPEGETFGPVKGNSGVYALNITGINIEEGDTQAERNRLSNTYFTRAFQEFYESVKRDADIKDFRAKFY